MITTKNDFDFIKEVLDSVFSTESSKDKCECKCKSKKETEPEVETYEEYSAWQLQRVDDAACDIHPLDVYGETLNKNFVENLKRGEDCLFFNVNEDEDNPIMVPFDFIPSIIAYLERVLELYETYHKDEEAEPPMEITREEIEKMLGKKFKLVD